jgi:hypothetical protein
VFRAFIKVFVLSLVTYTLILLLLRFVFNDIAVFDAVLLTTIILLIINALIGLLKREYLKLAVKDVIISLLVLYISFTTVLVNVDRSRSVFVLSWVSNNLVKIEPPGYDLSLINSYASKDYYGIEMRLNEHMKRNLIQTNDSQVSLTNYGSILLGIIEFSAKFFNLQGFYKNSN